MDIQTKIDSIIESFKKAKAAGKETESILLEGFREIASGIDDTERGTRQLASALGEFSRVSTTTGSSLDGLISGFKGVESGVSKLGDAIKKIPLFGDIASTTISTMQTVSSSLVNIVEIGKNVADAYDGMDKGTRELIDSQYKYTAGLGLTFDQAVKNKDLFRDLITSNSELAGETYFNSDEFIKGIGYLQEAGIAMEDLGRASGVAANGLNNMQAMSLQARAMGMDISEYSRKIADMVRKNGLSIEDSMKLMASSQTIAGETGLKIDEVTQSLESATSGFQKMGATMDFGRPVLKGFADSIRDIGLGISQAGDLASDFSRSLLGIVNNPALAYVTAMKGGFAGGMGGPGGVLNPGIQMQAMMLNQEPGAQAELARSLSTGMREMITSQTGGEIITVKEAAAGDAGTQSRFYAQQQMLGSVYGISDTMTQSRVLEYLQQLERATAEGDQEQIDKINEQIADATEANDKTFDIQQKISQSIDKSLLVLQEMLAAEKVKLSKAEPGVLEGLNKLTQINSELLKDGLSDEKKKKLEGDRAETEKMLGIIKDEVAKAQQNPSQPPPAAGGSGASYGATTGTAPTQTIPTGAASVTYVLLDATEKGTKLEPASTGAGVGAPTFVRGK
jgi:hypothetical protein